MDQASHTITLRYAFSLTMILIATIVLNSQYGQAVCNVCTVIPACVFSFAQLSDRNTRTFAYRATLFYWTISGVLLASDSVFVDWMGYFLGKFLLLTALFLNVVYQHRVSRRLSERQQCHTQAAASLIRAHTLKNVDYQWKQAKSSLEILDDMRWALSENSVSTSSSAIANSVGFTSFSDVGCTTSEVSLKTLGSTKVSGNRCLAIASV
uniref:Uncharacterized protein n=1 Tax=Parascaris univalens TaxID=6257 RepID=A0A915AA09_PARUN